MGQSNRDKPVTKMKYSRIFLIMSIGIWFLAPIILLRPFKRIYFAPLQSNRIGHFIGDTEILLARIHKDEIESQKQILVFWIPNELISNYYVYKIWKQKIHVIPYNLVSSSILLTAIYLEKILKIQLTYRFIGWDGYLPFVHLLEKTPTVFSMPQKDKEICLEMLKLNGIDTDRQWVCILARDDKFLNEEFPEFDWNYNSYRNSDINSFKLAAEYLAQKEIIVFRMGSNVEKTFSNQKDNFIIDYANCSWKNEMLDIYLAIKSLFFISTGTGLDAVSVATRKPLLWVNQAQPLHVYRSKKNFMFITKYFYSILSDKFLSPSEFYEIGIESGFTVDNPLHLRTQDFRKLGIEVWDNSDVEIRDATIEMHEMLTSNFEHCIQFSEMQRRFWRAFPDDKRLDNVERPLGKVSEQFLIQNSWLTN